MRRVLLVVQVLVALDAAATADQRLRQRIVVVRVAVGHVAAEQNDRMVEHRSVAFLHVLEALHELREHRGVVVLDEPQVGDAFRESAPVRRRVEGLVDSQVRVRPHAGFLDHLHRRHSGPIRLPGQREHFELHADELAEILRRPKRRARQIDRLGVLLELLHAELDLADRIQVVAHPGPVGRVELAVQARRRFPHVVEQAVRRLQNGAAFFVRIALAEHAEEHLPRIAFHRQRLIGRAERDHAARLGAEFHRRQRRLLAEMLRGDLVDRHADAGLRIALARADAVQPRLFDDAVRAGAFPALVAQTADDGHVLAHRFQRLEDERKIEIAAGLRRLPFVLQRAMREVHEAQARAGCGGRLRQRRSCRDHRVQQRQRDRRAGAFEHLAP